MLRSTPTRLRQLTRRAPHQPHAALDLQQLRTAVVVAVPSPICASLRRLSQSHQCRTFHITRARLSEKKPSYFAQAAAVWKEAKEKERITHKQGEQVWGIVSYEPIPDAQEFKNVVFGWVFGALIAYHYYPEFYKLLPLRTNPGHLMKESLQIVNKDPAVTTRLGTPITGQGERVYAWHQVESVKLPGKEGKPSRLRIKYYLTGPKGTATVFAEVVEGTAKGEYSYLVVQVDDTKEVVAIIDHREHDDHKVEHELKPKDPAASGDLAIYHLR